MPPLPLLDVGDRVAGRAANVRLVFYTLVLKKGVGTEQKTMPPRFVEVVDVGAEASLTVAAMLASGQRALHSLSFDVSQYLNENTTDALIAALHSYNLTLDAIPVEWDLNFTVPHQLTPDGRAKYYLIVGMALMITRELIVAWRVRCLLRRCSLHKKE